MAKERIKYFQVHVISVLKECPSFYSKNISKIYLEFYSCPLINQIIIFFVIYDFRIIPSLNIYILEKYNISYGASKIHQ